MLDEELGGTASLLNGLPAWNRTCCGEVGTPCARAPLIEANHAAGAVGLVGRRVGVVDRSDDQEPVADLYDLIPRGLVPRGDYPHRSDADEPVGFVPGQRYLLVAVFATALAAGHEVSRCRRIVHRRVRWAVMASTSMPYRQYLRFLTFTQSRRPGR